MPPPTVMATSATDLVGHDSSLSFDHETSVAQLRQSPLRSSTIRFA